MVSASGWFAVDGASDAHYLQCGGSVYYSEAAVSSLVYDLLYAYIASKYLSCYIMKLSSIGKETVTNPNM